MKKSLARSIAESMLGGRALPKHLRGVKNMPPSMKPVSQRNDDDINRLQLAYLKREKKKLLRLKWAHKAGVELKSAA